MPKQIAVATKIIEITNGPEPRRNVAINPKQIATKTIAPTAIIAAGERFLWRAATRTTIGAGAMIGGGIGLAVAGMVHCWPHPEHLPVLPANESSTCKVIAQVGH
jgi:hypothetical protein